MSDRFSALVAAAAVVALASGCGSFKSSTSQASSESSSNIVSSPFKWSSKSSKSSSDGEGAADAALRRDVLDAAASLARSSGDGSGFHRDVSRIAGEHGVVDWDADPAVWAAIGRGLERGEPAPERRAALEQVLARAQADRIAWIRSGYGSAPAP